MLKRVLDFVDKCTPWMWGLILVCWVIVAIRLAAR